LMDGHPYQLSFSEQSIDFPWHRSIRLDQQRPGAFEAFAADFLVGSISSFLPRVSRTGECVLTDEQIAGAECGGAFQKQDCTQGRQRRRKPRAMQLALIGSSPLGNGKLIRTRQFFCSRRQISILHLTAFAQGRREQWWRVGERFCVWRGIKFVEKIREATVKGIAVQRELRDCRQSFRSHILPSSNRPSTRYCVFTGRDWLDGCCSLMSAEKINK